MQVLALGYLLPFGHRAAIAEVSTRVFLDDAAGEDAAVMQVTHFLTIVEPTVTRRAFAQHEGRGLPLATLTATTERDDADHARRRPRPRRRPHRGRARPPGAAGADHLVDYRCVDRGGDTVSFALPATFVDDEVAYEPGAADAPDRLRLVANSPGRLDRREVDLGGQRVSYADSFAGGQTGQATHRFRLAWEGPERRRREDDLQRRPRPGRLRACSRTPTSSPRWSGRPPAPPGPPSGSPCTSAGWTPATSGGNFDLAYLTLGPPVSSLIGADSALGGVAQFDMLAEVFNQSAGVGLDLPSADAALGPRQAGRRRLQDHRQHLAGHRSSTRS